VHKSKYILYFTLILIVSFFGSGQSQTPEIERLIKIVESSTGKAKIDALSMISKNYYSINPKKGVEYAQQALQMADELNIPETKTKAYSHLGINYLALYQPGEARSSFNQAFKNATFFKDSLEIGNYYLRMGAMFEISGKLDSALIFLGDGLVFFQQINNDERTGTAFENIGTIHLNKGELRSAITNFLEAINYYEKANSNSNLPFVYLKLGNVYSETRDFETSEKWFRKGHDEALVLGDFHKASLGLNAIGIIYMEQEKYADALAKYDAALKMAEKVNNSFLVHSIYGNMGNVYQKLDDFKQALYYHQKSYGLAVKMNQPLKAAQQEIGIGLDYKGLKDYRNARKYFENALPVFLSSNAKSNLLTAYENLIKINNLLEDYKKSVQFYIPYIELKDSLNKTELNLALDSLKVKFNTEQTLIENKILINENDLQEKKITFQRTMLIFALVLTGLLISLAIVIFRSRLKIKKSNQILAAKNNEITRQSEELRSLNTKLTELALFKDSMNSFLAHDLKNPLNTIINYDQSREPDLKTLKIKQLGLSMLNIVSNMLDISKYESQDMKLSPEDISLATIINKAFYEVEYLAVQKSIGILLNFTTDYHINADTETIKRVFINLFTNAIKYSAGGTRINVMAEEAESEKLKISVIDQGEGIEKEHLPFIFEKFNRGVPIQVKSRPSSTGLGLTFCKMAIESHKGEIGVESFPGKGSTFWFTLPLASKPDQVSGNKVVLGDNTFEFEKTQISEVENELLQLSCSKLQHFQVSQISDIKEVINTVKYESPAINKWKTMVLKALSECNDVAYSELIKFGNHE